MIGERFGRLAVLGLDRRENGRSYWRCQCDCGALHIARGDGLKRGDTTSCGCYGAERRLIATVTHGRTRTRAYVAWVAMKARCLDPDAPNFKWYGGRGIRIADDRWLKFEPFHDDMGDPPPGTSLDRIDNDGHYEPGNCRWATAKEQANNQRRGNNASLKKVHPGAPAG